MRQAKKTHFYLQNEGFIDYVQTVNVRLRKGDFFKMANIFKASFAGTQEVPPNQSKATAVASLELNEVGDAFSYNITAKGLDFGTLLGVAPQTPDPADDVTSLHFHAAPRGTNGAVVFGIVNPTQDTDDLIGFINPDGSTTISGIWEQTDPANQPLVNFSPALLATPPGGETNLYLNIHTKAFPGGEIRAQVAASSGSLNIGNNNNDNLIGGTGDDTLFGKMGTDILSGNEGDDLLNGNEGSDTLNGGIGNDSVYGGKDNDFLFGNEGDDVLLGNFGADSLVGAAGNDLLYGNQGADTLDGNAGNDTIYGGKANDVLFGNEGEDVLIGNLGADSIAGGKDNDFLYGNQGADTVDGNAGNDFIYGGQEEDLLIGSTGSDFLSGDKGNDTLRGVDTSAEIPGLGEVDTLVGGEGADTFVLATSRVGFYNDRNDADPGLGDYALITDFKAGEDVIQMSGLAASYVFAASPNGLPSGTAIYLRTSGQNELLAIVQGVSNLTPATGGFTFV